MDETIEQLAMIRNMCSILIQKRALEIEYKKLVSAVENKENGDVELQTIK